MASAGSDECSGDLGSGRGEPGSPPGWRVPLVRWCRQDLSDPVIVCVSGNPSIDKLFEVEHLVVGEIHRPVSFVALPGGKGIHVAQVATLLGAGAIVTGVLAGHLGRWVAERLAAEGVRMAFVWGPGETRSSLSVADRATGRLTEFYEEGVPLTAPAWSELVEIVDGLLDGANWLALAGSVPAGADIDGYPRLIAAARERGVPWRSTRGAKR